MPEPSNPTVKPHRVSLVETVAYLKPSYRPGRALRPPATVSPSLQTRRATSE